MLPPLSSRWGTRPFWLAAWWPSSCCWSSSSSSSCGVSTSARCWKRWADWPHAHGDGNMQERSRVRERARFGDTYRQLQELHHPQLHLTLCRLHVGSWMRKWPCDCRPAATPSSCRPRRCPHVLATAQQVNGSYLYLLLYPAVDWLSIAVVSPKELSTSLPFLVEIPIAIPPWTSLSPWYVFIYKAKSPKKLHLILFQNGNKLVKNLKCELNPGRDLLAFLLQHFIL